MLLTIKTTASAALKMGRNATAWTQDIDVTTLTEAQREALAAGIHGDGTVYHTSLIAPDGIVSAASIQADLDARAIEQARRDAITESDIVAWLAKSDDERLRCDTLRGWCVGGANSLPSDDPRVKSERARLATICDQRDASDALTKKERDARVAAKKEAAENRKIAQLTAAVNLLGTDSQRERWVKGVMLRSEIIDMIWADIFAKTLATYNIEALHNAYHLPEIESGEDIEETDKKTLTDAQWTTIKTIKSIVADCKFAYYHQYYDGADDDAESCDLVRITKTVGEYTLECDVLL